MGAVGTKIYRFSKRIILRYNVENRAFKLMENEKLPSPPQHIPVKPIPKITLSKEALEDIYSKNEQLNDYLKKVYLTSTPPQIPETPSKRPKPKKENEVFKKTIFFEPLHPAPGCCTLSNIQEILFNYHLSSEKWNADAIAKKFELDKDDLAQLIYYVTLFHIENYRFMNLREQKQEGKENQEEELVKIEFEVNTQHEKKPIKKLASK